MRGIFREKLVSVSLIFVQALALLAFGIIAIVDNDGAFGFLPWVAGGSLIIAGIARSWGLFSDRKILQASLTLAGFVILAAIMLVFPIFIATSASRLFGVWFLINSFVRATICLQCIIQKMRGKVRYGLSAIISLFFAIFLLFQSAMQIQNIFIIAGIYLILFSVALIIDAISEILLSGKTKGKFKKGVRISLPLFITALLPGKLLDDFNEYFKMNPDEAARLLKRPNIDPSERSLLEIFIHLSDKGAQRAGHVDLRFNKTAISYGCYDYHSHRFGGMVSQGTMVVCESNKYIEYSTKQEGKMLIGFEIALTAEQKTKFEIEIRKITDSLIPWKTDYEKGDKEATDAASLIVKATDCKIHKMSKGIFRNYYALNTNCVKLVENLLGNAGLSYLRVNGICVPGSFFTMLDSLYNQRNTIVIKRNIYGYIKEDIKNATASNDSTSKNRI